MSRKLSVVYLMLVCLALASGRGIRAGAAVPEAEGKSVNGAASWQSGSKKGQAVLSLQLATRENIGDVSALQMQVAVSAEEPLDAADVKFEADSAWKGAAVQDFVYDPMSGMLTVVVADTQKLLEIGREQKVGTLTITSPQEIQVMVEHASLVADGELYEIVSVHGSTFRMTGSFQTEKEPSSGGSPGSSGSHSGGGSGSGGGGGGRVVRSSNVPRDHASGAAVYLMPQKEAAETLGTWEQENTFWRFKLPTGIYARNTWIYKGGFWYHMGEDGIMSTGWCLDQNSWYYLTASGAMATGWILDQNIWYYLQPDTGIMRTGWLLDGGYWYYLAENGAMCTGWQTVGGLWYYLNPTAPVPQQVWNAQTGRREATTAGQRPYGAMYADTTTPDGSKVDASGAKIQTGTQTGTLNGIPMVEPLVIP